MDTKRAHFMGFKLDLDEVADLAEELGYKLVKEKEGEK
jgi:hypothetical protein